MSTKLLLFFLSTFLTFAQPGTFTNTGPDNNSVMVYSGVGETNICNPTGDFQIAQGGTGVNFAAIGFAGCVSTLNTSTNLAAIGLQGSASNSSTVTNAVGGYFPVIAIGPGIGATDAQRVRLWGVNPLTWDSGYNNVLMTNELDFSITQPGNKILGLQLAGRATADMSNDSAGVLVGPLSGHKWPVGYYCTDGATTICFYIGTANSGTNQPSQPLRFASRTSGGVTNAGDIILSSSGGFQFNESAGAGWSFGNTLPGGSFANEFVIFGGGGTIQAGTPFTGLVSAFPNGSHVYCPDCVNASNPCAGSGSGAYAKKLGGVWDCR